jgi:CysZ protein
LVGGFFSRFFGGAGYHLQALEVLGGRRSLWKYVAVPVALNLVVGGLLYAGALYAGWQGVDMLVAKLPAWAAAASVVLRAVMIVALLFLTGLLLAKFGVILGSPWYGRLSEELEELRLGRQMPESPRGQSAMLSGIGEALVYEVKKLFLTVAVLLPLFVIGLVPVVGPIVSTVGGFALGVTIVCLDFLDPSLGRRQLSFRQKLATVFRHMPTTGGFGAVALVLVSIPVVNLLTVPLSVAAASLLYADQVHPQLTGSGS